MSRDGGPSLPDASEALEGVLTAAAAAPRDAPADATQALLSAALPAAALPGISETEQAALDLDAILSMAFEEAPEAAPPPAAPDLPLSDDALDDLFGDWDLGAPAGTMFDDPADDFDALADDAMRPADGIDDAEIVSDAPAFVSRPARSDAAFDAPSERPDEAMGGTLPDLDLDDIFAIDPVPPPARTRADDRQAAASVAFPAARENRRAPVPELDRVLKIGAARPGLWARWRPRLIWAALLAGLVYVAFLPYPYEVGGDFVVQPLQRSEARSRTDGEIIQLNVNEGDWVAAGDILAILSNWDELRDVAVNEADDAVLRANLATMENGAKPEAIAVAREVVSSAELQMAVTQKDLGRQQTLFDSGTIAEKVLETARNAHAAATAARDGAAARLALVSAPTQSTEIDSQKAAIARNQQELDFARLMLEYANIRAPQAGQIVSSLSGVPVGAYLAEGKLFAELENNRTVIAEVDMPETYIQEVAIGAQAELRLWSDPETSIFGTVRSIAPRAEERDFGWVIRVEVEVPNPDGRLTANMTGFGKVAATERPVWQAFSQAIVGFLKIELWSWVP